jgi:hypothetical protein
MKRQLLLLTVFLSSFTSAQTANIFPRTREFFGTFYENIVVPIFSFLLGPEIGPENSELFFAKLLLFILLLSVISIVLSNFPLFQNRKSTVNLVSVIVSLLGVRFLSAQWVQGILLPYNTLGLAVISLLPLIVFTYFVYHGIAGKTMQRIAWIVAGSIYILLFFLRVDELGDLAWIYGGAAILCLLAVIFNHQIDRLLKWAKIESVYSQANEELIRNLRRKLNEAHQDFANNVINQSEYDSIKRRILYKIKGLS